MRTFRPLVRLFFVLLLVVETVSFAQEMQPKGLRDRLAEGPLSGLNFPQMLVGFVEQEQDLWASTIILFASYNGTLQGNATSVALPLGGAPPIECSIGIEAFGVEEGALRINGETTTSVATTIRAGFSQIFTIESSGPVMGFPLRLSNLDQENHFCRTGVAATASYSRIRDRKIVEEISVREPVLLSEGSCGSFLYDTANEYGVAVFSDCGNGKGTCRSLRVEAVADDQKIATGSLGAPNGATNAELLPEVFGEPLPEGVGVIRVCSQPADGASGRGAFGVSSPPPIHYLTALSFSPSLQFGTVEVQKDVDPCRENQMTACVTIPGRGDPLAVEVLFMDVPRELRQTEGIVGFEVVLAEPGETVNPFNTFRFGITASGSPSSQGDIIALTSSLPERISEIPPGLEFRITTAGGGVVTLGPQDFTAGPLSTYHALATLP